MLGRVAVQGGAFVAVALLSYLLVWSLRAPEQVEDAACGSATPTAGIPEVPKAPRSESESSTRVLGVHEGGAEDLSVVSTTYGNTSMRAGEARGGVTRTSLHPIHGGRGAPARRGGTLLEESGASRPGELLDCALADGGAFRCGECATDGDCPEGQGCVINYKEGSFQCAASDCEDDSQCPDGFVCRVAAGGVPGPVIQRCLQAGVRRAGETCSRLPASRAEACEEDLHCINHRCGRPCVPGTQGSCPEGHTCEESSAGAACLPDCRKQGCSEGEQCAPLNGGGFQCLDLVVDECSDEKPCAEGANCIVRGRAGRAGRFCAAACDSWREASCSSGQVCGLGGPTGSACYSSCDPQDLRSCPMGWLCTTVSEDLQRWGCLPDFMSGTTSRPPRPSAVPTETP
ncbi:hypothetical protein MYSTI_02407 [Myxococcus stipitatus DSM 14675]|uniref:EGF-like domain-containing protein n=1 Tax=Myxococcus stipitatus (strain DSM 14675 / JCM 12634 / Mx s8) TaxID=1278073 RepID=L7U6H2_MYXSD|nr:hypothetical protein MYSTI_02407 [Myxococcus stipitatus DSM 14675]